jgi:hypothetical protein
MSCYYLHTPNNNLFRRLLELDYLYVLAGDKCYAPDQVPRPEPKHLVVDETFIKRKGKLIGGMCGKIRLMNVETLPIPNQLQAQTLAYLSRLVALPDPSARPTLDWLIYYEGRSTELPIETIVQALVKSQQLKGTVVIACLGDYYHAGKKLHEALREAKVESRLQLVERETELYYLAQEAKNQFLTGNLSGYVLSMLNQRSSIFRPQPLFIAGQPTGRTELGLGFPYQWTSTKYWDRLYYINLDHRTDRKEQMEKMLQSFGLAGTRIAAVNGKNIKWQHQFGVMSKFWNQAAFAYCFSYRLALVDAMKHGYERVLILDDDAEFNSCLFSVLEPAFAALPEYWHMLYLGANHGTPNPINTPGEGERISDCLYRLKGSNGSHAIILHQRCFQPLLNFLASPYGPFDVYLSMYQQFFPCYLPLPGLAKQRGGYSDILAQPIDYEKDWKLDYFNWMPKDKVDLPIQAPPTATAAVATSSSTNRGSQGSQGSQRGQGGQGGQGA